MYFEKLMRIKEKLIRVEILSDGRIALVLDEKVETNVAEVFDYAAKDIMTANCKKIRVDALASEAMAIFHKHRIDDLPVVDEQNRPVGLIDVQDIVAIKIVG